jgi:WD40 repeat protein
LSLDWKPDNESIFIGTESNLVKRWDLVSEKIIDMGIHEEPVKDVYFVPELNNVVISSSLDGRINFWDGRQQAPVF